MTAFFRVLLALGAAHGFGLGCSDPVTPPRPAGTPARGAQGPDVVARVDGVPIRGADLRRPGRVGADAQAVLREAIRFELLAQEARRRGLDRDPAVKRMRKRALANLFVRRAFGDRFTRQSIPEELVARAYALNWMQYDRPELVRMGYFFVLAPESDTAERRRAARKLVRGVHEQLRARGTVNLDEFDRIVREAATAAQRQGLKPSLQKMTVGRVQDGMKKPAVDAAFALRPGRYSGPIPTKDGFFIVYKKEILPPLHRPLSAVQDEIRAKIFEDARAAAFEEFIGKLERARDVRVSPSALRLLADRGGGAAR